MIQSERLADVADVGAKNTEEHLMEALARQRAALVPPTKNLMKTRRDIAMVWIVPISSPRNGYRWYRP